MNELNIVLDPNGELGLQHQLRLRLIDAIHHGVLPPGRRLPSSRHLAERCSVSRNTVALAYEALIAEGHLVSRPRSGIFVAPQTMAGRIGPGHRESAPHLPSGPRLSPATIVASSYRYPGNWHRYPFPFIDGRIDPELMPAAEWREAMRLACGRGEALRWTDGSDGDDAQLVEEIRTKLLPGIGIDSGPDEVLLVASLPAALQIVLEVLAPRGTPVLAEEPMGGETRRRLQERQLVLLEETALNAGLPRGTLCITNPNRAGSSSARERQRAQLLLAAAREADGFVIDRFPFPEVQESTPFVPPLRALGGQRNVLHLAALSSVASCGAGPGLIVADARIIERLRLHRRRQGADLSPPMLRAWYYFIGLGHYSATVARTGRILAERRRELRDALNHYLHTRISIAGAAGSSAYWVSSSSRGAPLDALDIARRASHRGVLLEPEFADGEAGTRFCMGVTSIGSAHIREGVQALARLLRDERALDSRRLADEAQRPLRGAALQRAMAGATLLYSTVYGEPCTIEVLRDGRLVGTAGFAGEDCDTGRWWISADQWVRQWDSWAYAEPTAFQVIIEGDQLRWYNADGLLADTAVITRTRGGVPKSRSAR